MSRRLVFAFAVLLAGLPAFGASSLFEKGEALFVQNQPGDAAPLLESALTDDPSNEKVYLYLGIAYQQLGELDKAIDVLKRGLTVSTSFKDLMYYNIGNDLFARKDYAQAEQMYTKALGENQNLAEGYLNRANSRLQLQSYDAAVNDYTIFLQLQPQDPQRPQIEQVMRLLRQMKEAKLKQQEEEVARQKALMNDVMNSLNNAGDDAKNLSVESIKAKNDPVNVDIKD
ncbi:MAG TPA: tetratricopeptide repeat protein [Spirochaetia bacterium]|nr:tetratricopeptide repeat protein [Spirochaetia bacterium]